MSSIMLIGPPGSGKTTMAVTTATRLPVHVLDLDRKVAEMRSLAPLIERGDCTYWELDEPLVEETIADRLSRLAKNERPKSAPQGWTALSKLVKRLDDEEVAKKAGTIVIDSYTRMADHAKRMILYVDEHGTSTLSPRNYGSLLSLMEESTTILIDYARRAGKDIIFTVHERVSEIPSENTRIRKTTDKSGAIVREMLGTMTMKMHPSIDGSFSAKAGSYFTEVYRLYVDMVEEDGESKPKWFCQVLPDALYDLRTSYDVKGRAVWPPDFGVIWGLKPEQKEGQKREERTRR